MNTTPTTAPVDTAMQTVLFPNTTRGRADHGWLKANHSFSFANFYNPQRMGFGSLMVLNEDYVAPDKGFPTHPHDNMEIVTIVLEGAIAHKDSEGNAETVPAGDVQYMSAGTGVRHSEFNPSSTDTLHLFQVWILPHTRGLQPTYNQKSFAASGRQGNWQRLVSPDGSDGSIGIRSHSYIHRAAVEAGKQISYRTNIAGNGLYVHVASGNVQLNGQTLGYGDALGLNGASEITLTATEASDVLVFEVPMQPSR